jgi:hypothetical protein
MGIGLKKKEGSYIEEYKAAREAVRKDEIQKQREQEQTAEKMRKEQEYIAHKDIRQQQDELWEELEKTFKQKKQISMDRR